MNNAAGMSAGVGTPRERRMQSISPATGLPMVCWLEECRRDSVPLVGGKCSSLGELINAGVRVPPGFALTTEGYRRFMADAGIDREVQAHLVGLDPRDMDALERTSAAIRSLIEAQPFSAQIEDLVAENYRRLSVRSCVPAVPVAVRSSATAEDLPARVSPASRTPISGCGARTRC